MSSYIYSNRDIYIDIRQVSIDRNGKDLLDSIDIVAVGCGFVSRATHSDADKSNMHR
jgi:hypothetical protein